MKISVSVDVPDLGRATSFYVDALGCSKIRDQGDTMVVLSGGNIEVYLIEREDATNPAAAVSSSLLRTYNRHWTPVHLDFIVDDVETAVQGILAAGGTREGGEEGSWGAIAHCADPFGNGFCVIKE